MNTFYQIPIISWTSLLALAGCGAVYLFSRIRKEDMNTLRLANEDLRSSIEDKGKEIDVMKGHILLLDQKNDDLTRKVEVLENHNQTLENLVVTALKEYFIENPTMAKDVRTKVK